MNPYKVVVTRKPDPAPPEGFVCDACQRDPVRLGWLHTRQPERPPICRSCAVHWSRPFGQITGVTRGDRLALMRLRGMATLLDWEAMNGCRV